MKIGFEHVQNSCNGTPGPCGVIHVITNNSQSQTSDNEANFYVFEDKLDEKNPNPNPDLRNYNVATGTYDCSAEMVVAELMQQDNPKLYFSENDKINP